MIVYENPWFAVIKDGNYHYIREAGSGSGAAVFARRKDQILLLRMKRPVQGDGYTIEIPRGYAEPSESALDCARRELREETGFDLCPTAFHLIGHVQPNSGLLATRVALFLADIKADDTPGPHDNEAHAIFYTQMNDLKKMVADGQIEDGFTLSALACLLVRDHP